jgi:hypothetical protein
MTSNNGDVPSDANPSDEEPLASDVAHIVYNPLPVDHGSSARQQRMLRRMARQRKAHPLLKKIPWILFPVYGFMRLHDPNYEEHFEQYEEKQRREYGPQ